MASKKKANYACKSKVECLTCGKVILSENQTRHLNYTHKGLKSVKFRFYNDAKQPRLQFNSTRRDSNLNVPRGESNNNETLDDPDPTLNYDEEIDTNTDEEKDETEVDLGELLDDSGTRNIDDEVYCGEPNITLDVDDPDPTLNYDVETNIDAEEIDETEADLGEFLDEYETVNNDDEVIESEDEEEAVASSLGVEASDAGVAAPSEGPRQPILDKYNPKSFGTHTRDFQASWYQKYPWIDFDTVTSTVSCYACKHFVKDDHFTYDNWKKTEKLKKHSTSQTHLFAMTKWGDSQASKKSQKSVLNQIRSQHATEVAENRRYLQIIIETVAYLAKQNIAFRGHNESRESLTELSDTNRGNFLELLSLRSGDSFFLKERLEAKLKNKMSGQWTSGSIQNEIINLLADFVEKKIVAEIKSVVGGGAYIGVICDETSDISRHEQVSLVISYIDESGQKRESFLKFIKTEKTDGETLFHLISENIKNLGLDLENVVGLGFDGAANMRGANKGVATRFKDVSPCAVYVHCYGHLLNLAVKDCLSSVPLLRNTLGTIQILYDFIEASPKRHAIFVNTETSSDTSFVRTLKSLSVTRWTAHYESVKGVDEELERTIKCLCQIVEEFDSKSSAEARSLLIAVLNFEFVFGLSMLKIFLPSTSRLSSYIQGTTIDIRKVRQNAELTIKTLESCRSDESFEIVWQRTALRCDEVKEIIETVDTDVEFKDAKLPTRRPSRRQQALLGESSAGSVEFNDVRSYQRVTNYYPALDKIVMELKSRFSENDQNTLCALEAIIHDKKVSDNSFDIVSKFYSLDLDLLKAEHHLYCHFKVIYK